MSKHWRKPSGRMPVTDWPHVESDRKQWQEWAQGGGYPRFRDGLLFAASLIFMVGVLSWVLR